MKTLPISPHSSNITGNVQKASKNEYEGQREQQKGILAPVEASTKTKDDDMGHDEVLEPEVHGVTEARCPPTMRSPHLPTQKERESHERTHVPYRSWCKQCVKVLGYYYSSYSFQTQPNQIIIIIISNNTVIISKSLTT